MVELRRYSLHPGRLPDLLGIFDRHLIEPQEDAGMTVGGTFADEADPSSFTWLRGFSGHSERVRALETFYGGPVWARHRDAANATMVDSDDVLLLRATRPARTAATAVSRGGPDDPPRTERVLLGTCGLGVDAHEVETWFASTGSPRMAEVLGTRVAAWRTDPTPNGFPRLPVRDERVLVWLAVFPDAVSRDSAAAGLATADVGLELERKTTWQHVLHLAPTPRSSHPAAAPSR